MQCSASPPFSIDDVLAVLDGSADPAVRNHIQQCASCAARLKEAQQMDVMLKTQLRRADCPPAHQLGEYHLGLAAATDERNIVRHLRWCVRCSTELEALRVFLSEAPTAQTEQAPSAPTPQRVRPRWRESIARWLPRTGAASPAFALRGHAGGPLMAEANGTTVVLDTQPGAAGRIKLFGQIVADELDQWTDALVEVRQSGELLATTVVDDLGSFSITDVPPGNTDIRVTPEHGMALVLETVALPG